jgi:hypothetical protein
VQWNFFWEDAFVNSEMSPIHREQKVPTVPAKGGEGARIGGRAGENSG